MLYGIWQNLYFDYDSLQIDYYLMGWNIIFWDSKCWNWETWSRALQLEISHPPYNKMCSFKIVKKKKKSMSINTLTIVHWHVALHHTPRHVQWMYILKAWFWHVESKSLFCYLFTFLIDKVKYFIWWDRLIV